MVANIFILGEPSLLRRLVNLLSEGSQYGIWATETLSESVKAVERVGRRFDLLVIDVSLFDVALFAVTAVYLLSLFARACPKAKLLVLTTRQRHSLNEYIQLRKPFTDTAFLDAMDQILLTRQRELVEVDARPRPTNHCRAGGKLVVPARGLAGDAGGQCDKPPASSIETLNS